MILILGGTTEGRAAVRVADEAGEAYYYSTKGDMQEIICKNGIRLTGGMNADEMETFCREKGICLLIDAAHPFATLLHKTIAEVSTKMNIPVVRYERKYPPREENVIWCDDYEDAILQLEKHRIHNLLALTGVQTISRLRNYWEKHPCRFRVLDRKESLELALQQGFPQERILFYQQGEDEYPLIERLQPDAILTKESGETGYFNEKVKAAQKAGILIFAVKRPQLPDSFITVYGENGLRKQIERLVPGFFHLRSGYTTGACATAAAKAALIALLTGEEQWTSTFTLPSGEEVTLPVENTEINKDSATCTVIKDAGDDPDVTNGYPIVATVEIETDYKKEKGTPPEVLFYGGEGVGKVTLPGLGLAVGEPAINNTPRKMITQELSTLNSQLSTIKVTISVPGGKELAQKTFNPKLGIVDGISIIGTSGIVRPFSSEAFVASIRREVEVAIAIGVPRLVINSGAKSERFVKAQYPELPAQAFVHYGNFIGETIKIAAELNVKQVTLGVMIGKAVKLAEGYLDTHSKKVVMNKEFLKKVAQEAGCSHQTINAISEITLARELWTLLSEKELSAYSFLLIQLCHKHCAPLLPNGTLTILLIDEEGKLYSL